MPETVRVRIAVAVDHKGNWACSGMRGCRDWDDAMQWGQLDDLEDGESRHIVWADLPLPSPATEVEGQVEPAASKEE